MGKVQVAILAGALYTLLRDAVFTHPTMSESLGCLPACPNVFIGDPASHFSYGVVSSFSSVLTTNTASSLAGSVLLAFSSRVCRSPGNSEKFYPAR
jgi:hypothetical protein